ncbi:MAG: ribokinase [Clostridiaceae bacterium]|jgi:ribokinase|nr:ribokinase [Clostridiaceae bacterium]
MRVLNFGSLNYDYVYAVDHISLPGETLSSKSMKVYCGGKGLNQSVALARAGVHVYHAGTVGSDGDKLVSVSVDNEIDISLLRRIDEVSGHAIIQVDRSGQNSILLHGGANMLQTRDYVDKVLSHFNEGDIILLQNEINLLDYIITKSYERKLIIILNPSPYNSQLSECNLDMVSVFILNEIEGNYLTEESNPGNILEKMRKIYTNADIVLTLGDKGAYYMQGQEIYYQEAFRVVAVDTTGAGDTFTGYFVSGLIQGLTPAENLRRSAKAAAMAVSRSGATTSIPMSCEVDY